MARFTVPAAAILLVLVTAPPVAAQVRFRAETTVVYLDVVVRDATGRPIGDLEATDFKVLEDGVVQPLVWFDRSNAAASAALAGSAKPAAPALVPATDLPQGPPQSIFAIVFHQLTAQPRAYATQAAHALVDRLAPGDFAGVYVFDQSMTELAPFTRDREALHRAIHAAAMTPPADRGAGRGAGADDPGPADLGSDRDSTQAAGRMRGRLEDFRTLPRPFEAASQGDAFRRLVEILDAYVGRRAVVLFSEGLATPDVIPRLETVADLAAPAHVSFYTIDAGGLRASGRRNRSPRRLTAAELTSVSGPAVLRPARIPELDLSQGLRPLAELTGGVYVSDTNDLTGALAQIDADRRSYYVLVYRTATGGPASPRAIEVRVTRPNTHVRARTLLGRVTLGVGSPRQTSSP